MNVSGRVAVLVPMLGRAHTMPTLRGSLQDTTDRARIVWLVTSGDTDVLSGALDDEQVILFPKRPRGDYAVKINVGAASTEEPLIFTGGCDLRFHPGWLDACQPYLDAGAGVVGTNDLGNPQTATGALSTHSLVARWYIDNHGTIDEPGKVLHDGYWHEFVDNELVETAKARGLYAHAPDAHVEHLHPLWGKADTDGMYRQAARRMAYGRRLYNRRRRLWT